MPKGYANMGATGADIISALTGGPNPGYQKGYSAGVDARYKDAQIQKLGLESQKIMNELLQQQQAMNTGGEQLAFNMGVSPEDYGAYQRYKTEGIYTEPDPVFGKLAPGPNTRPQTLTDEAIRNIEAADLATSVNRIGGGSSNAAQIVQALIGGSDLRTRDAMMRGDVQPADIAPIMAAMAGKDPNFTSSATGGKGPSQQQNYMFLTETLNMSRDQALELAYPSESRTTTERAFYQKLLTTVAPSMLQAAYTQDQVDEQINAMMRRVFPDWKGAKEPTGGSEDPLKLR